MIKSWMGDSFGQLNETRHMVYDLPIWWSPGQGIRWTAQWDQSHGLWWAVGILFTSLMKSWTAHWTARWDQSHGLWFTNLMKSWTGDSLDSSMRSVTWFMMSQVMCSASLKFSHCNAQHTWDSWVCLQSECYRTKWEQVSSPHRGLLSSLVPTYWT